MLQSESEVSELDRSCIPEQPRRKPRRKCTGSLDLQRMNDVVSAFEASKGRVAAEVEVIPHEPSFLLFDGTLTASPEKLVFMRRRKTRKEFV
jgi:hypothetical protein